MRIKMLTSVAGEGFSHGPGDEGTGIPEAERARYVAAGLAVEIVEAKPAPKAKRQAKARKPVVETR